MGIWTKTKPPSFKKDAVKTRAGWCHPKTGEVLACYSGLSELVDVSTVQEVSFELEEYVQGDVLKVLVRFNELVDVTAGATLVVSTTGEAPITLTASAQLNVNEVVFEGLVPEEEAELSIGAQTLTGTIVDNDGTAVNKAVSAPLAEAADIREIPAIIEP